ncbi:nucleoside hydrolase [Dactylosporangium sp. CA-233914]|uniref:nucleoside hydrolase n=1 Tax=Dactylosporangium sp. CA-233914 TaxID=3239934 RepID=UPI003D8F0C59
MVGRRAILQSAGVAAASAGILATGTEAQAQTRRRFNNPVKSRVLVLNDFAGDPDGLFALAQAVLQTSTDFRGAVGGLFTLPGAPTAADSAAKSSTAARRLLDIMGYQRTPVYTGSNTPLRDTRSPRVTDGARAIVKEATRTDTTLPLFVTCGGSLTDVASALLMEPAIAKKFTLVWIGGAPHPAGGFEYNLSLDTAAGQVVFNESDVAIWQVTSAAYGQCLVSFAELELELGQAGKVGNYLLDALDDFLVGLRKVITPGDAYSLGDSPLALLTALYGFSPTGPTGGAGTFEQLKTPRLNADMTYTPQANGRPIKVYEALDTRTMHGDLFAKLRLRYGKN